MKGKLAFNFIILLLCLITLYYAITIPIAVFEELKNATTNIGKFGAALVFAVMCIPFASVFGMVILSLLEIYEELRRKLS